MKIFVALVLFVCLVQSRRLHSHGLSFSDITSMPMDALGNAVRGDFSGAAQKYAMSKMGLSESRTLGSYFGQQQPQSPLSGLGSMFGGSNNAGAAGANPNAGGPPPTGNPPGNPSGQGPQGAQGGLAELLSRFTGKNQGPQDQNPQQPPPTGPNGGPHAGNQGGFGNLLSQFTGGNQNPGQPAGQPEGQQSGLAGLMSNFLGGQNGQAQPQSGSGFSNMVKGLLSGSSNAGNQGGAGGTSFLGRLFSWLFENIQMVSTSY